MLSCCCSSGCHANAASSPRVGLAAKACLALASVGPPAAGLLDQMLGGPPPAGPSSRRRRPVRPEHFRGLARAVSAISVRPLRCRCSRDEPLLQGGSCRSERPRLPPGRPRRAAGRGRRAGRVAGGQLRVGDRQAPDLVLTTACSRVGRSTSAPSRARPGGSRSRSMPASRAAVPAREGRDGAPGWPPRNGRRGRAAAACHASRWPSAGASCSAAPSSRRGSRSRTEPDRRSGRPAAAARAAEAARRSGVSVGLPSVSMSQITSASGPRELQHATRSRRVRARGSGCRDPRPPAGRGSAGSCPAFSRGSARSAPRCAARRPALSPSKQR